MKFLLLLPCFLTIFILPAQVTIQANIPKVIAPNSEFAFNVKINKGDISNFAKYQIDVPEGVTLSEVETKTGSFSFENNRAKIIWVAIPSEAEFEVIFRITTGQLSGEGTFNQKFYFLESGTKKEVAAEPISVTFSSSAAIQSVTVKPSAVASSTAAALVISSPADPSLPASPEKKTVKSAPEAASAPAAPVKESPSDKSIDQLKEQFKALNEAQPVIPPAEPKPSLTATGESVIYRIQIGAYGENPGKAKYAGLPDAAIVKEGDFYKVLVGNFKSKEGAFARKTELLEKGFKGFIVSYQNGQRIK